MDYEAIIEEIVGRTPPTDEIAQRRAFRECLKYADEHLIAHVDYNYFVVRAANACGQPAVNKDVRRLLEPAGDEAIELSYDDAHGPELRANSSALLLLSELFRLLSQSQLDGEHVHFTTGSFPFTERSFPLTVVRCADSTIAILPEEKEPQATAAGQLRALRDIAAHEVAFFMISVQIPPTMPVTRNRVYRVTSIEPYENQRCWGKHVSNASPGREFVFHFRGDDGADDSICLLLDDPEVHFFRSDDLRQAET